MGHIERANRHIADACDSPVEMAKAYALLAIHDQLAELNRNLTAETVVEKHVWGMSGALDCD
jgi:hypothetical protein